MARTKDTTDNKKQDTNDKNQRHNCQYERRHSQQFFRISVVRVIIKHLYMT